MRTLGIDYGDKRIGLAISDELGIIANPLEVYYRKTLEEDFKHLEKIITEKKVNNIVIGLPINMDGTLGERAQLTKEFGEQLASRFNLPIIYVDERWTSIESERILIESNVRREKRKTLIDKMAAQNILQRYLDSPKTNKNS
ncbi:MAG TPA: Holliday junction resolvase RuvX [Clostridia bacterium]